MSVSTHIDSLQQKHNNLKKEIKFAYIHHLPDIQIKQLKKKKLRVKDELEGLGIASNQNNPEN